MKLLYMLADVNMSQKYKVILYVGVTKEDNMNSLPFI